MRYEVIHQKPNGDCVSVFFKNPEQALEHAKGIMANVTPAPYYGFVSVSEVQVVDGEIEESAILFAQAYGGGF